MIKTNEQLRREWGMKRYATALGIVSSLALKHGYYIQEQTVLIDMAKKTPDAFEVYSSRLYYEKEAE